MKIRVSKLFLNPDFTFDSVQSALHAKDSLNSANNDSGCSILKIEYAKVKLQNIQIHKSHYLFKKTLHLVNPETLRLIRRRNFEHHILWDKTQMYAFEREWSHFQLKLSTKDGFLKRN